MLSLAQVDNTEPLFDLLRQTALSGTQRRALLLHTDRLPPALAKPHHHRLARDAIAGLITADRAQHFELSRGRVAIIWRQRGGPELETAMSALGQLLADLPPDQALPTSRLVSLYDLPAQADWLMDDVAYDASPDGRHGPKPTRPLDAATLIRLERELTHAEISRFIRWRPVLRLSDAETWAAATAPTPMWEERYIAAYDVAANFCPDRGIRANPWLFHRLTRVFDQRVLTALAMSQDLHGSGPIALNLNVATILGPNFLHFDSVLPAALRGAVTLNLTAEDILAEPAAFVFARDFARARGYRLLLRHASAALLAVFDIEAAGLDYCHVAYSPELTANPEAFRRRLPPRVTPVLTGAGMPSAVNWAYSNGFALIRGK